VSVAQVRASSNIVELWLLFLIDPIVVVRWEYVWSAVRLQAKSLWRVFWVCANVSGLFVELPLLAIMESARRWSTKWVELLRVLIPTQA
jgi:hypothetical protein